MRVRWRAEARADLFRILDFIREQSPSGARRIARRVLQRTAQLREFPHLGRPGREAPFRELVVAGTPYIIAYRVSDDEVEITNIFHGAQAR